MIKVDASQAEELARQLEREIGRALKRAALATALRIVQKVTVEIIPAEPRPPVDRRIYAAGFRAKSSPEGAVITNSAPYADIIEYGARGANVKIGRQMIDALTEWILRKQILGGRGKTAAAVADQRKAAAHMAWAVALTLKKKGIFNGGKGLGILQKALRGIDKLFAAELKREIEREL